MRYETIVNIAVERIPKDYELEFEYEVVFRTPFTGIPIQAVDLQKSSRVLHGLTRATLDAEWFWDICPESVSRRLDTEMIAEWNRTHGLTLTKQETA